MMSEGGNASIIPFPSEDDSDDPRARPVRTDAHEVVRMAEAIVFASAGPVSEKQLAARLPDGIDVPATMLELQRIYAVRGVNLVRIGEGWAFRTAGDLATTRRLRAAEADRHRATGDLMDHAHVVHARLPPRRFPSRSSMRAHASDDAARETSLPPSLSRDRWLPVLCGPTG